MAGFENDVMISKNMNFDETSPKPHLGVINGIGKLPIGTGNTFPTPEILGGNLISPDNSIAIGYASPNITLAVNGGAPYYSLTPLIVGSDVHSQYATIGAALLNASPNNYIFIKPGTYTEDLHITKSVVLVAFTATGDFLWNGTTVIVGQMTIDANVNVGINGIDLRTSASNNSIRVTNQSSVVCQNCLIEPLTSTSFFINNSNANVTLENCNCNLSSSSQVFNVSSGTLRIRNGSFNNGNQSSSSASTVSTGGFVQLIDTTLNFPITTSGSGVLYASNTSFGDFSVPNANLTWITTAGTGTSYLNGCSVSSGTASAVSIGAGTTVIMVHTDLNSSNTNVLTGAGTLNYALLSFSGSSSGHNVTTETPLPTLI